MASYFTSFCDKIDEEGLPLAPENIRNIRRHFNSHIKCYGDQIHRCKVEFFCKEDSEINKHKLFRVQEFTNQLGFQVTSDNENLGEEGELSWKIPSFESVKIGFFGPNDDILPIIQQFKTKGLVFLWRRYDPPVSKLECLCWRLYCCRLFSGVPKEHESKNSGKPNNRVHMCVKSPLYHNEARELAFGQAMQYNVMCVFDVLQAYATALKLIKDVRNQSRSDCEKCEKMLKVSIGVGSKSKISESIPMQLVFTNWFIEKVFQRGVYHATECNDDTSVYTSSTMN